MSRLELFLLGPPRIQRDGVPVEVDTRKAIALLAYLAVTGERQRRDSLAGLLWPETDQTPARAALRRTLSTANKALAGEGLVADRETVGLDWNGGLWVDLVRFRSYLDDRLTHGHPASDVCDDCLTPLAEAVELCRDDFMAGFTLRDSPGFDDWQVLQGEGLRRDLSSALDLLARCHVDQGQLESAIAHTRRRLALDIMDESVHRRLMQLFAWSGQRATAMRQYRECVRVLDRELGVPPLEETTELYQAIREDRASPAPVALRPHVDALGESVGPVRDASSATRRSGYPMVGRAAELETMLQIHEAIADDGRLVVLEGEAGIGKTRLAEEFLSGVQANGGATVTARCYGGEANLSYRPIVECLRSAREKAGDALRSAPQEWLNEAARLLPELAGGATRVSVPPLDSPGAQGRFFEAISQILLAGCRGPVPGVLFLDDLHWADEATVDFLVYMVRRLDGHPLCIVTTWRREEVETEHRLRLAVSDAQRSGTGTLISLSRLGRVAVEELVGAASAGVSLPSGAGERLYSQSEGLPFFLVEYLANLSPQGGAAGEEWSMPTGVRGLLHSRLAAVSEMGRQLLDTAAVIGRSFDFDTLQGTSGRAEEETVLALEELIDSGLVNEVIGSATEGALVYDFSHEQLRALAYEETSLARRRLLHRRVADALLAGRRRDGALAGVVAEHYRMAGREAEAAEYFKLAGDHSRALFANAEALGHYRSALVLGHTEARDLHTAIGDLQTLQGDYERAIAAYETAASLCDPDSLAVVERKLGNVHLRRGDWQMAASYLHSALASLGVAGPGDRRSQLLADLSLTAYHTGDTAEASDLAVQAAELAEDAEDVDALAQAHNILGILARSREEQDSARQHLENSLALAETLSDPSARVAALNNLALAYGTSGEVERAIELAESALMLCASQGDRHREAALHNNLADLLHTAGRAEAAMSHLKQAVSIFAEIGAEAGPMQPEIWKLVEW